MSRLRKTRLRSRSLQREREMREYYQLQSRFLARPENRDCAICNARRQAGERIRLRRATEVHHWAGRRGRLLCYVPYFLPSCRSCRDWPHVNLKKARACGVLAPANLWEVFPKN